jgi:hypothetical protein
MSSSALAVRDEAPEVNTMSITVGTLAAGPASTVAFSEPKPVDIKVYRGDSGRLRITVTDAGGGPVNISSGTWDADIRDTVDAVTTVAQMTCTPVPGDTSSVDVKLAAVESAKLTADRYVYDVQMTLDTEVQTLIAGAIEVTKDVSRTP